jgi:hypothetical protein
MISDFEQALATYLGANLPAPFAGNVVVAPAPAPGGEPSVVVGVTSAAPTGSPLGGGLPQPTPAVAGDHRVLALDCQASIVVAAAQGSGRAQQADGVQRLLWLLDEPEARNGSVLVDGTDRGFVLHELAWSAATAPLDPLATGASPVGVTLTASGLFWPIGIVGQAGRTITHIQVRGVSLPVTLTPASPQAVAGGDPISIAIAVEVDTSTVLTAAGAPGQSLPFTTVVATLTGARGAPASGQLTGGNGGTNTLRTYPFANGLATITYAPPATGASDVLTLSLDDGSGGAGVPVGQVPIEVR